MEIGHSFTIAALSSQLLVGLSRAMILFIVSAGMSFVLGVLRVPNVAHGSLYMIGAFAAFSISTVFGGGSTGFWIALIFAPLVVALVSFIAERSLFCHLYEREHLMLLLFTFALMLILGDLVKIVWGADYRSITAPDFLQGMGCFSTRGHDDQAFPYLPDRAAGIVLENRFQGGHFSSIPGPVRTFRADRGCIAGR
jgi:branched-subunit amino acid ABC-type transport system permease component